MGEVFCTRNDQEVWCAHRGKAISAPITHYFPLPEIYGPPKFISACHHWMVPTDIVYIQCLSLVKLELKVAWASGSHLSVTYTCKCVCAISLDRIRQPPLWVGSQCHHFQGKRGYNENMTPRSVIDSYVINFIFTFGNIFIFTFHTFSGEGSTQRDKDLTLANLV